jgi:hypothetical protein
MALTIKNLASPYSLALSCFHGYQPANHLKVISDHVVAMFRGDLPNILLVQAPPRRGKSDMIGWAVPSWFLLQCPHGRVMHTTYSQELGKEFGGKCLETYHALGPDFNGFGISHKRRAATNWKTTAGGGMVSIGRGGTITGRGANLFIIDDPIKNAQEALSSSTREMLKAWWSSTVYNRLEPGGVIIVTHTRWYRDDPIGYILEMAAKENRFAVTNLVFPEFAEHGDMLGRKEGEVLWPQRESAESSAKKRDGMGSYWFRAQYQQDPSNPEGTMFPSQFFNDVFVKEEDWPKQFECVTMGIDPSKGSKKGDFCGIVKTSEHEDFLYVESDLCRDTATNIARRACRLAGNNCDGLLLEANSFQHLLADELDDAFNDGFPMFPVMPIPSLMHKDIRIARLSKYIQRRLFKFRDTPSNRILVSQLMEFPHGQYDDGPDGLEMSCRLHRHLRYNISPEDSADDVTETLRA